MHDEYQKLLHFFSLKPEEKAGKLEEVFEDASQFLDHFKYVFEKGSVEEKREFVGKLAELQNKIREETTRLCSETGLTEEQITQFATNPQNFQKDQWDMISRSKAKLESQAQEIQSKFQKKQETSEGGPKKKRPKKRDWLSS